MQVPFPRSIEFSLIMLDIAILPLSVTNSDKHKSLGFLSVLSDIYLNVFELLSDNTRRSIARQRCISNQYPTAAKSRLLRLYTESLTSNQYRCLTE